MLIKGPEPAGQYLGGEGETAFIRPSPNEFGTTPIIIQIEDLIMTKEQAYVNLTRIQLINIGNKNLFAYSESAETVSKVNL